MKTTSRGLSKQLKEAGAKQESQWIWREFTGNMKGLEPEYRQNPSATSDVYVHTASFDCHELLEGLPQVIMTLVHGLSETWGLTLKKTSCGYEAKYMHGNGQMALGVSLGKTPAEALGRLKLWCLKEGHCKE